MADVTMPQLGETVTEGTVIRWFKRVGDTVASDEILFEVSTDKVDSEVPSPVSGIVTEILAGEGDVVEVGQVLARVGSSGVGSTEPKPETEPEPEAEVGPELEEPASVLGSAVAADPEMAGADPEKADSGDDRARVEVLSPVVRRLIAENGIDPATIIGTGLGGRITRADVEAAIRTRIQSAPAPEAPVPTPPAPVPAPEAPTRPEPAPVSAPEAPTRPEPAPVPAVRPPAVPVGAGPGDKIVPLDNIRKRTAEHMVRSKQTSPHVLTAIEVDYEGVEQVRRSLKATWKADEGFSLTYLPFIARAVVDALGEYPHLNATFGRKELIVHGSVNLAVAVDIDFNGLLAPVIKGADGKRLRRIARDIVDLATRARTKQLGLDDLAGGTFTLTNAGQYGTMMQFPIINQPQVAILSTDGVSRKPVVVTDSFGNESIAIHSVGVLAMAWDHRAFDGAYAAAFLHRVKEIIETRDWNVEVI